jgi:hypothetical protein
MTQAQGILSSGVPLSSVAIPPRSPSAHIGASLPDSGAPAHSIYPTSGASESSKGNFAGFGAPALRKAYVLRFRNSAFLFSYHQDDGIYFSFDLQRARLFSSPPDFVADIFRAEILTVLTDGSGRNVRRTLLDKCVSASNGANHRVQKQGPAHGTPLIPERRCAEGATHNPVSNPSEAGVAHNNRVSAGEADAGVERADGEGQTPPSFLIRASEAFTKRTA